MPNMTEAEFLAYESRRRPDARGGGGVRPGAEHELHQSILAECRRRGWIALYSAMNRRTHRNSGEPDFIILADGGRVMHVECKTRTGKLSVSQQGMRAHYRKLGHDYRVVRDFGEFIEAIKKDYG